MTTDFLATYLTRINCPINPQPDLATLSTLISHHTQAIPFENFNALLGWPIPLDVPALQEKMITDRRGGYCFEQNALFQHALREIGFQVRGLAARVIWNQPENTQAPRTHMLLLIECEGETLIADVGFGGNTPTAALRLIVDLEQETAHEPYRLLKHELGYKLQVKLNESWRSLYIFDLQEQLPIDYIMANHFVSTFPTSHFLHELIVSRTGPKERVTLFNNRLTRHCLHAQTEHQELKELAEIKQVLTETFNLSLQPSTEVDALLRKCLEKTPERNR